MLQILYLECWTSAVYSVMCCACWCKRITASLRGRESTKCTLDLWGVTGLDRKRRFDLCCKLRSDASSCQELPTPGVCTRACGGCTDKWSELWPVQRGEDHHHLSQGFTYFKGLSTDKVAIKKTGWTTENSDSHEIFLLNQNTTAPVNHSSKNKVYIYVCGQHMHSYIRRWDFAPHQYEPHQYEPACSPEKQQSPAHGVFRKKLVPSDFLLRNFFGQAWWGGNLSEESSLGNFWVEWVGVMSGGGGCGGREGECAPNIFFGTIQN